VIEAAPEGARARIVNSRGGGYYDDIYGQPDGDIKPRALGKPGEPFRTSGLRLTLGKDGTMSIKERKYFKP